MHVPSLMIPRRGGQFSGRWSIETRRYFSASLPHAGRSVWCSSDGRDLTAREVNCPMATREELLQLIGDAEQHIRSEKPSAALPYLHRAFFYSTDFPEVKAIACLRIATVCRSTGQHFIGAEFFREANNIASSLPPLIQTLSGELTKAA